MRILLLNQFYLPDVASTGQHAGDLAQALADRGHEVHVLCSQRSYSGGRARFGADEVLNGVHVHRVLATGMGRASIPARAVDYGSFYALALWRVLALRRMDLCIALTTPPFIALVGVILNRIRNTRLVLWNMDTFPEAGVAVGVVSENGLLHKLLRRLRRMIYRRAWRIISLGETMTELLCRAGADPRKILLARMWVPSDSVHPQPHGSSTLFPTHADKTTPVLMYSGNVGMSHDLETFVRAVAGLDPGTLRFLIVGHGANRRPLQRLVASLGLDCVRFHDPKPLCQLSESLSTGDIHVVSQRPGTQGCVVPSKLQGIMAAGRPTLLAAPDDCEVADAVRTSQAGLVVPPGNVEAVREALASLCADRKLRKTMGQNARAYYEDHYRRDHWVGRIIAEIEASSGADSNALTPAAAANAGRDALVAPRKN